MDKWLICMVISIAICVVLIVDFVKGFLQK